MLAQPTDIVNSLGYLGIFLLIFVFPFPQEIVLPLAGFMAAQGKLTLVYIVMAGVMGSTVGALPWYYAGRYIGEKRLKALTRRRGKWIKLSADDVQKAKSWFDKYGSKAVLFSQAIPGIRTLIALPAGISRMNLVLFLLHLVFSAIAWQGLLVCAGYLLGNYHGLVNQYISSFTRILVSVMVGVFIIWLVRREN